jgi:hypothetical protein
MNAESIIRLILVARGNGSWTASSGLGSSVVTAIGAQGVRRGIGWLANGDGSNSVAYAASGDTDIDGFVDILNGANKKENCFLVVSLSPTIGLAYLTDE